MYLIKIYVSYNVLICCTMQVNIQLFILPNTNRMVFFFKEILIELYISYIYYIEIVSYIINIIKVLEIVVSLNRLIKVFCK